VTALHHRLTDEKEVEAAFVWLNKYWNKPTHPLYYCPKTLDEAVSLLEEYREEAKVIAGGIDLVGLLKSEVLSPRVLVNLKGIHGLSDITGNDSGIQIGALSVINDLEQSSLIREQCPLLAEIAHSVGSPQVRNMATLGGNLCQEVRCWYYRRSPKTGISFFCRRKKEGNPCYAISGENENHAIFGEGECYAACPSDMAVGLLALDARINTMSSRGERVVPIRGFYAPLGHVLESDEIITSVSVPRLKPHTKQRFLKFRPRKAIDFSTVSVSSVITSVNGSIRDGRIIVGGVSPMPHEAVAAEEILLGEPITETVAEKASEAAVKDAMPLSKNAYKVPLVKALVKRSILE
jgi:xanthine dehydrogenase YagS FAD-binding subunit